MSAPPGLVQDHLRRWREDLIDLSKRNRLLYFKHLRSGSLEFEQDARALLDGLGGRGASAGWGFHIPPDPPDEQGLLDAPDPPPPRSDDLVIAARQGKTGSQIERSLRTLARKAQAEFLDAGLWVLYVGLGLLHWNDGNDGVSSPLYLLPVKLERRQGHRTWRLVGSDDGEPALNPSLAVRLERDGIALPALDELEDDSYRTALAAVRHAVTQAGWRVDETAVLSTFTFQKEVIYRDLRANEDTIATHAMIRLLAEGPTSSQLETMAFAPEPEDGLDDRHPPEDLACILNADATQRRCLIAARQGHSFVMDGPPGTGKSQTIANVIAQLLRDGKTVLFVSEKAAALEVVQNRLTDVGLAPFILALHSHRATRKAVAKELGDALTESPRATSRFDAADRARIQRKRKQLTDYAVAANEVRRPFQRSLHDVIGEISKLNSYPLIPLLDVDTTGIDAVDFERAEDFAAQLSRAWAPVDRGDDFLWRDLIQHRTASAVVTDYRHRVSRLRTALKDLQSASVAVHEDLWIAGKPTPNTAPWLQELLRLVESRPPIAEPWMTTPNLAEANNRVAQLAAEADALAETERELSHWTPDWSRLDPTAANSLDQMRSRMAEFDPAPDIGHTSTYRLSSNEGHLTESSVTPGALETHTSTQLCALRDALDGAARIIETLNSAAMELVTAFGVNGAVSPIVLDRLAKLGELANSETPPEPDWFHDGPLEAAREAHRVLSEIVPPYIAQRDDLMQDFKPTVLDLSLKTLRERFANRHKGLRKLGGAYRADKATLASAAISGRTSKETLGRLDDLVAWQQTHRQLETAESEHATALGAYYPSRDRADFDLGRRAIEVAEQALEASGGTISTAALAQVIGRNRAPSQRISNAAAQAVAHLASFRNSELASRVGSTMLALEGTDLQAVADWCRNLAALIGTIADEVTAVEQRVGKPVPLADAHHLLRARSDQVRIAGSVNSLAETAHDLIGDMAAVPDAAALRTASDWVALIRKHLDGEIEPRTAAFVMKSGLSENNIVEANAPAYETLEQFLAIFEKPHRGTLRDELNHSYDAAFELLDALDATATDLHTWSDYVESRDALVAFGLGPAIAECERLRKPASDIPHILRLALLRRWADQIVDGDDRLRPGRGADRHRIRTEFQRLDRKLVQNAAADVINACAERRPTSTAGGAGFIRQQAQLTRRHKPVRTQMRDASEAAQRLKPCFMMSPLSVSQFLPAEMSFDAVIFDEASQVKEADAIGCIYRGKQLIVAGDQKQLPPTSFFDRTADTDDEDIDEEVLDFESVLDRCKAQGFVPLPLNWHYRSRHEALITYSNHSFYNGRLHTFPGAVFDSADLGVELFNVDGIYRRGGTRDNPAEAAAVVDRVLFHRRHHAEATLGVVALSTAQQAAVEAEIERRSESEPELRHLTTDDRLSGFFVKNLESVQGDERDIIILTIGYGPDEAGKLTMNFGPMNREGGERRLNVAVTRARQRVEIVSSISGGHITSDSGALNHLRRYLDFAERGTAALAIDLQGSVGDAESPFEEEVLRSIRAMGQEAVPQVGVAGYRIDIGIRHPNKPGSYLLGVECDGASYHSSKVARDRDRLRQEILEGLGWTIHRIWSTAWFTDRAGEEARLRSSIDETLKGPVRRTAVLKAAALAAPTVEIDKVDFDAKPDWVTGYVEPQAPSGPSSRPEFHDSESRDIISWQIQKVVETYGPIHCDAVLRAVRAEWGLNRAGKRMRDAFARATSYLGRSHRIQQAGDWLRCPGQEPLVRVPMFDGQPRRPVGEVPPDEIQKALLLLLNDAGPSTPENLRQAWGRLYGWARIGADIEIAFERTVRALIAANRMRDSDLLRLVD